MADEFKDSKDFFKVKKAPIPPNNETSDTALEEYFGKKENLATPKPTTPNHEPNLYDSFSKSPEEAQRKRVEDAKRNAEFSALYAPYIETMDAYGHHAAENRWKFWEGYPGVGFKIHLNVAPQNVQEVSRFLKGNDYEHKYLSGGEVEDGKIFTVYTGSKEQTERIVKEIANASVSKVLQPPLDAREIPYAPNIVGRFVGAVKDGFQQYGTNGISALRKDAELVHHFAGKYNPQLAFANAHKAALEKYEDYYGGGITYYQPQTKESPKS